MTEELIREMAALVAQAQEELNPGSSAGWTHEMVVLRDHAVVVLPLAESTQPGDIIVGMYSNEPIGAYSEFWHLLHGGRVQCFPEAHPADSALLLSSAEFYGAPVYPDIRTAVSVQVKGE